MDNVILSDEQTDRVFEIGGTGDDYWRAICIAQARHLLKLFNEPCTEHEYLNVQHYADGHFSYNSLQDGLLYYKHRRDCPECMKQIEKEIEG